MVERRLEKGWEDNTFPPLDLLLLLLLPVYLSRLFTIYDPTLLGPLFGSQLSSTLFSS